MKIGIYGGSFNPIHNGHVAIAELAIEKLNLDLLIVIPVGNPCHQNKILIDGNKRLEMCKIAFKDEKKVLVSDIEIKSDDISYTYDTLLKIIELYPKNEYFEIIGEDSAAYFENWKNYIEILNLCKVIIFRRDKYDIKIKNENFLQLKTQLLDFSSTKIRKFIKNSIPVDNMIPKNVAEYIKKYNLYKNKKIKR